jgi:DNA-binding SARP family transcriptional activator
MRLLMDCRTILYYRLRHNVRWTGGGRVMTDVLFRVLGPLEVEQGGRLVPVTPGKQLTVLAALLLRANRTVSIGDLADTLWDTFPPADARGTVQKYVMRLRRALAFTGTPIHTEPDGYRIETLPGQVDIDHWEVLVEQGEQAARDGDPQRTASHLAEALELWRAVPPLANVAAPALHRNTVPQLVERYLQALELRIDMDLQLGRHAALTGELIALVRRHPLRERFWAQRMRALYATGRQGEALESYREVTRLLADELGVDPGPELRAAHEAILRRDDPGPPPDTWAPARQLPMPPAAPVGRRNELSRVSGALTAVDGPQLVLVTGAPGVGKTAVALHAAHAVAERFPDGQLYADLRGHRAEPPPNVEKTLAGFLRALGVPADTVPAQRDELTSAFRSLTADRRLLVVLDDAADARQVRALLPGGTGCAVLVTSRCELTGLLVDPGARPVPVRTLARDDAEALLRQIVGAGRPAAEPEATAELVRLCGGLPLALRVAAAQLATHPGRTIRAYVDELRRDPLATLRIEHDGPVAVADAIAASYRRLAAPERRILRLLGTAHDAEITSDAVPDRFGEPSHASLEHLAEAGLLERDGSGYRLHPLVAAFARSQAEPTDAADGRARRNGVQGSTQPIPRERGHR